MGRGFHKYFTPSQMHYSFWQFFLSEWVQNYVKGMHVGGKRKHIPITEATRLMIAYHSPVARLPPEMEYTLPCSYQCGK